MSQEANGRESGNWERKQQLRDKQAYHFPEPHLPDFLVGRTQEPSFYWPSSLFVSFSSLSLALCSPRSLDPYCMRRIHGLCLSILNLPCKIMVDRAP
ncbi:hypothetical protein PISMIDRAFT_233958 [Pisolithus microcarpus 441]|uniref:Uncharacterized protein n=1 Tax=Pisolithus microcarpus 441 TaxID=765257 RepID=A0A0C9YKI1_9AGAM|nr:hypothetical protein PISMIDRAFT_233958 [Pisolithus microcarpus 441]